MGTNFYMKEQNEDGEWGELVHIGKRSGAGAFCLKCGHGTVRYSAEIHTSREASLTECPRCGVSFESYYEGGFRRFRANDGQTEPVVRYVCSFSWAGLAKKWKLQQLPYFRYNTVKIVDEYGGELSVDGFLRMFDESGITYEFIVSGEFS